VRDLSSGDAKTRWSAAISLGMQGNPRSTDVLKEILVHGDADTRLEVVTECLKEIKDDKVIELALKALRDGNEKVREECVDIIDELQVKDKKVFIKPLIEIISNIREKEDIRHSSILAIDPSISDITKYIEDEETVIMIVEALKRAEKDESEEVSIYAGSVGSNYLDLIVDKKLKIPLEDLFEKDDIEEYKKSRGIL
jgi:HEAT repeat protein